MSKRFKIPARTLPDGIAFTAAGQEGRTLLLLHQKGAIGVVAYEFQGGPPFRLPAYTWALMRKHGLVIETRREIHEWGWHGRFVLHTLMEIVAIDDPARRSSKDRRHEELFQNLPRPLGL